MRDALLHFCHSLSMREVFAEDYVCHSLLLTRSSKHCYKQNASDVASGHAQTILHTFPARSLTTVNEHLDV